MFLSEEDESAAAQKLAGFLFDSYADDIHRILLDDDPSKLHFPLVIEFAELMEFDPKFAGKLYLDPHKYLPFLKDAAQWAQDKVLKKLGNSKTTETKKSVHVRIDVIGSPLESPEVSPSIGKVRVKHMRKLIALKGTVIRSGGVKMIEYERCYMCRKCKHSFEVYPELEARNRINLPPLCPKGGCTSASFQFVEGSTICHDYQEIKIQENVQLLGIGSIPRSMPVILMDDLVDSIKAGGKQPLCDLSIGSCGTTIGIILSSMSSVLILHIRQVYV
ncbi:probable DNA helicase MCM9 [Miscanthus floridulus]|uniref:probable DNA helicase MCM9 n=1 Tax=Miscanthus floridulus TaxID=154761 RepID=UPI003457658E